MPIPQPGGVLNLLLLVLCAGGGWFYAAWSKEPRNPQSVIATGAGTARNQPGVFAADGRAVLARKQAGAREFDELAARYGSGSDELGELGLPLLEKWAAGDAADAATAGLARCMAHTPDLLPLFLAALAAQEKCDPGQLLAALPDGPLREPAMAALAEALGRSARGKIPPGTAALTRGERTLFLREWHRGRATAGAAEAEQSAAALTDVDDRAAARSGCLQARVEADPETVLGETAIRDDYPEFAVAAFRAWLAREATGPWRYVASRKGDARLPELCAALLRAEIPRRHFSEALPEIQSLMARQFPAGPPLEVLAVFIPLLAAESTLAAQKFTESVSGSTGPGGLRTPAWVLLFDALCTTDPAAAWRLAGAIVQKEGATDERAVSKWSSALEREAATPSQRLAAGFPDFSDMTALVLHWLERDPASAIATYAAPGVEPSLQRLVIKAALSPLGTAIPLPQLLEWAANQPTHIPNTIKAVAGEKK